MEVRNSLLISLYSVSRCFENKTKILLGIFLVVKVHFILCKLVICSSTTLLVRKTSTRQCRKLFLSVSFQFIFYLSNHNHLMRGYFSSVCPSPPYACSSDSGDRFSLASVNFSHLNQKLRDLEEENYVLREEVSLLLRVCTYIYIYILKSSVDLCVIG